MNKIKHHLKKIWKDESAQGATEYILLLVVVVAVVLLFKGEIMKAVQGRLDALSSGMSSINPN